MLLEVGGEITAEPCICVPVRYNRQLTKIRRRNGCHTTSITWPRSGSAAGARPPRSRVKLYEQGKLTHDKLPALAKKFLGRKMRALKRSE